jgi:hypothetical protein
MKKSQDIGSWSQSFDFGIYKASIVVVLSVFSKKNKILIFKTH